MKWPNDFGKVRWKPGEMSMTGGEDYMMPFGAEAKKAMGSEEEEVEYEEIPIEKGV